MKKRRLLATGGIMTSLLLASASPALAQSIQDSQSSQRGATHLVESGSTSPSLAEAELGIGADEELFDPESKRDSKQILAEEGFNSSQIQKILTGADAWQSYNRDRGMTGNM